MVFIPGQCTICFPDFGEHSFTTVLEISCLKWRWGWGNLWNIYYIILCCQLSYYIQELRSTAGLPWWRSGWESACQCRGHGFEPWSGKIPHAAERQGPWATIAEPVRLEPVLCNKRGRDSERTAHHDEEWPPPAATRESPRTETKTQHNHKINK